MGVALEKKIPRACARTFWNPPFLNPRSAPAVVKGQNCAYYRGRDVHIIGDTDGDGLIYICWSGRDVHDMGITYGESGLVTVVKGQNCAYCRDRDVHITRH